MAIDHTVKKRGENMNLKQANYIRTVVQEGSVTAAAKKLYVSQPSLSQTIRQAEEEYGVALFNRNVSPLRLTYAGERYLEAANVMLSANDRLENEMREIRQENSGVLRLGMSVQRAMQVLPLALPWFLMQFPHVSLELTEEGSTTLEELLELGRIDLALAAIESVGKHLNYTLIERETVGILAGKNSELASRLPAGTPITLDQVPTDSFVTLREGHSIRLVQDKLFRQYGIKPRVLLETDSVEIAKRVAISTGGCMLCTNNRVDDHARRQGAFYPLRDYDNQRHFYACSRKNEQLPRYAEGFIRIVKRVLAENQEMV